MKTWVAVIAVSLFPALCLADALNCTSPPFRSWRSAPLRVVMSRQGERVGTLERDLTPGETAQTEPMKPATPEEQAAIPVQLSSGDKVFTGQTFLVRDKVLKLALVEPAQGEPHLFADIDMDGSFASNERFDFKMPSGRSLIARPQVILKVQLAVGPFSIYPVRIILPDEQLYKMQDNNPGGRYLLRSPFEFVQGSVDIGGKPVKTLFMFDPAKAGTWADYGWQGMDINGDGWIQQGANSDEFTFANDESVIFHVNGHDVSISSIDLKSGTFVVREHPATDNTRISLRVGNILPDFKFNDVDGKVHQFSEFRGKYVLLDFWGTWCGPCRAAMPDLEKAWRQFQSRGFVVLGIDEDDEISPARQVLAEKGVTFPQAMAPSSREIIRKRFRISMFPTLVLLNPEGKVISVEGKSLRGTELASTLDKLLPKKE